MEASHYRCNYLDPFPDGEYSINPDYIDICYNDADCPEGTECVSVYNQLTDDQKDDYFNKLFYHERFNWGYSTFDSFF